MEMWKTIKGFDNYKVSTSGRSCKLYVHRLVAEAFMPNENTDLQVNHLNGVKSDNRLENLEWCTSSENHLHRSRTLGIKRSPEHMRMMCDLARVTHYKQVICVETNVIFDSVVYAAKSINRKPCSLVDALKGRHETCGGFHWKYKE